MSEGGGRTEYVTACMCHSDIMCASVRMKSNLDMFALGARMKSNLGMSALCDKKSF